MPTHQSRSFRFSNWDGFLRRAVWSIATGIVAAMSVLVVQVYVVQTSTASSLTSSVTQTQQEIAGIHRELKRMNATLEQLAGRQ